MSLVPLAWPKWKYRQSHESVTVCPEGLTFSKLYSFQAQLHFINLPCSQGKYKKVKDKDKPGTCLYFTLLEYCFPNPDPYKEICGENHEDCSRALR